MKDRLRNLTNHEAGAPSLDEGLSDSAVHVRLKPLT